MLFQLNANLLIGKHDLERAGITRWETDEYKYRIVQYCVQYKYKYYK
jgi:hypothetical protein